MKSDGGYQRYERCGELIPVAWKIFRMLANTPGVVTDQALEYVIWHKCEPPAFDTVRTYINHLRRVMGVKIRRHPGVGYEIVRNVT